MEAGEEAVRPFRQLGPAVDLVAPMPYCGIQCMLDAATLPGLQNYWKTENVPALPDTALDVILGEGAGVSSALSMIVIEPKGRAISRVGNDDTAFGGQAKYERLQRLKDTYDPGNLFRLNQNVAPCA